MNCTVDDRKRVQSAARGIRDCSPTYSVDVVEPSESNHDCWTLDAVLRDTTSVPSEVLRELALAELELHQRPSQNGHAIVVATA